ncbi:MAG TPA: hypothetical protein VIH90_07205 [Candidatus Saccharimonadales bacterium]
MTDTICDTCELYLYHCRGWMMRERGCDLYEKKKGRRIDPLFHYELI